MLTSIETRSYVTFMGSRTYLANLGLGLLGTGALVSLTQAINSAWSFCLFARRHFGVNPAMASTGRSHPKSFSSFLLTATSTAGVGVELAERLRQLRYDVLDHRPVDIRQPEVSP